jgi:hypothetical protein
VSYAASVTNAGKGGVLRDLVLRGSAYLALRQAISMVLGVVGAVVLTRQLGPSEYGRYVGGLAIVAFLTVVTRLGVDTFVIRAGALARGRSLHSLMAVNGCRPALRPAAPASIDGSSSRSAPFRSCSWDCPRAAPRQASPCSNAICYRRIAFIGSGDRLYCVAVPARSPTIGLAPVSGFGGAALRLVATLVVAVPVGLAWSRSDVRGIVRLTPHCLGV